jgi:hypothetical protein
MSASNRPHRDELEAAIRKVVGPSDVTADGGEALAGPRVALAVLGIIAAFFWGRRRGRR